MPNTGLVYSDPRPINITTVQEYKDWGFTLSQLKELSNLLDENIKSKRLRIKFLTEIPYLGSKYVSKNNCVRGARKWKVHNG